MKRSSVRRRRPLRRLLITVAVVLVLFTLFRLTVRGFLNAEIAAVRDLGYPTTREEALNLPNMVASREIVEQISRAQDSIVPPPSLENMMIFLGQTNHRFVSELREVNEDAREHWAWMDLTTLHKLALRHSEIYLDFNGNHLDTLRQAAERIRATRGVWLHEIVEKPGEAPYIYPHLLYTGRSSLLEAAYYEAAVGNNPAALTSISDLLTIQLVSSYVNRVHDTLEELLRDLSLRYRVQPAEWRVLEQRLAELDALLPRPEQILVYFYLVEADPLNPNLGPEYFHDEENTLSLFLYEELPWLGRAWLAVRVWSGGYDIQRILFYRRLLTADRAFRMPTYAKRAEALLEWITTPETSWLPWKLGGDSVYGWDDGIKWKSEYDLLVESIATARIARAVLAAERYRRETGIEPANLQELYPSYLDPVPIDPFSGRPFTIRSGIPGYEIRSAPPLGRTNGTFVWVLHRRWAANVIVRLFTSGIPIR